MLTPAARPRDHSCDRTSDYLARLPLELLACPACHGELKLLPAQLFCSACRRAYPVVDGIPVLIPERAEQGHDCG